MQIARIDIDLRALALALAVLASSSPAALAQTQGTATAPAAPRVAGTIELAEGDAMIEAADGTTRLPKVGERVSEGDTIVTFPRGELHVHMADGAYLSVRENSRVKIAQYVADGGKDDRSVLELLRGSLRSVTGWIGKFNRSAYQIKTPTATIGVRGTDHEPTVILAGDPRGEPGTYDKVNEGRTVLQSGSHAVEVGANQAAFHAAAGGARPRVLASVPAFFKPTPHEGRFVARSREVRQALDARRSERQRAVGRGQDGGPAAPPKAAPASPRSGAAAPSPAGAGSHVAKAASGAGKAAPALAKQAEPYGRAGPAAPRGAPPPGAAPALRPHDAPKAAAQRASAADVGKAAPRRPDPRLHEAAGERRAPHGAASHKR